MARIFPAELEAQYGVTISIFDSQASILETVFDCNQSSFWSEKKKTKFTCPIAAPRMDLAQYLDETMNFVDFEHDLILSWLVA